jgi:CelD/BcsL family acetyltransferase involved in cellulose biosynthesis
VQLITDISGLDAVESAWRDLATARGNAFITPEWFRSWLRFYGEKAMPFVIAVSRPDGSLEGVLPLVRIAEGRRRVLRFAGANLGEYFHPACHESDESRVVAVCSQTLQDHRSAWSGAILHNTDASAAWPRQLADGKGLALLGGPSDSMPYVALKGVTWEQYLADRSAKFRAQLRRLLRRLEADHQVEFRTTTAVEDLERDMTTFFELHGERWRRASRLLDPCAQAFHRDFASRALKRGWLRLTLLEIDGTAVAAMYAWHIGPRFSYYNGAFDPRWSRCSPGFLLLNRTLRDSIDEGVEEYDLMRGDEPYKRRISSAERRVRAVMLAPRLHPMRIAFGLDATARRAVAALPPRARSRVHQVLRPIARYLPGAR